MGGYAYSGCSWIVKAKQSKRKHDISILGQEPHYMEKLNISLADLLDLPHCALGKTINVKQFSSSPSPHEWDSLLSCRDNGSPSPERKWKALYPWDMINSQEAWSREERCLYTACLEGGTTTNSITSQPLLSSQAAIAAVLLLSDPLTVFCAYYT